MPRLCLLPLALPLLASSLSTFAQAPAKQWDRRYGGPSTEFLQALRPTSDGGYLLAGSSYFGAGGDKSQAGMGGDDYWVVKINAQGVKQWDKTLGGGSTDFLFDAQPTTDGGYILGGYSDSSIGGSKSQGTQGAEDYWVVKLDAQGNKQWDKTFGGSAADYLAALQQTSDGGYLLGGMSRSGIGGSKSQASQGSDDYWVVKLDAQGNKQWDKTFGGSGADYLMKLRQTADGGYLLGGHSDSGVSASKSQASRGLQDYWVIKLDGQGNKQWDKTIGGDLPDTLLDLQQTADGGYVLGGYSGSSRSGEKSQSSIGGTIDYWLVKLDAQGTKQWDRTIGGNDTDELRSVQQTGDGGYLLGGQSYSGRGFDKTQSSQGSFDYWVVKLDGQGSKQWDLTLGGSGIDDLAAVEQTTDGGYIAGGFSFSGLGGDKSQLSWGQNDYWVVKLGPAGPVATAAPVGRRPLQVYPNPAHHRLTVQLADDAPRQGLQYSLLDATGRTIAHQALPAAPGPNLLLQVGAQPAGLYLLRLEGPDGYLATQRVQLR